MMEERGARAWLSGGGKVTDAGEIFFLKNLLRAFVL